MSKVCIVLSGGMDSTVLAHHHAANGDEIRAISIDYGQRHRKELDYAFKVAKRLGAPWHLARLDSLAAALPGSSQTDKSVPVPEGHYAEESMKTTVVPNRNMILLAVALGHAIAHGCEFVSYAAHAGDHAVYPDCRPEFVQALNGAAALCDWKMVQIISPFIKMSKSDIVRRGNEIHVPFAETWSCYKGGSLHCGRCGTCVERREAFWLAGVNDPTPYLPTAPSVQQMVDANWKIASVQN